MFYWTVAFFTISILSGLLGFAGSTGLVADLLLLIGMSLCIGFMFAEHNPPPH
ncbi:hypothetical protein ACUHMQ_11445 [Chitinimonas sp. PSY-7]|uniref:hypothetical protein n=1 Tax=Chitinimonas sp. PSY-7 TaxID=3459088 RepID=UPI00403FD0B3